MVFHMKTTLVIPDPVMRRLKQQAAKEGLTISEMVEAAIRLFLDAPKPDPKDLPPLPTFHGGAPMVDIADRNALYEIFDAERSHLYTSTKKARRKAG
jgi:hypothetical protein